MEHAWPLIGPSHTIAAAVEPLAWGRATYSIIRVPPALVRDASVAGTRRVAGTLDGVDVNLALTRAPVLSDTFVWAGASLLRRLRLEVGDPVSGVLAPVDPDHVPLPDDVADALESADALTAWDALTPPQRRKLLVPIESAGSDATRLRRIRECIDRLPTR